MEDYSTLTYLTGDGSYTWMHYQNGKKNIHTRTIKYYQSSLPDFIRIHRSTLINPLHIKRLVLPVNKGDLGIVILHDDTELGISRRRWASVSCQLRMLVKAFPAD